MTFQMQTPDWIVTDDGSCEPRPTVRQWDLLRERYYLHQFLTEIIDLLDQAPNEAEEWDFLPQIRLRVRQLVTNSYWLHTQFQPPNPHTGVGIQILYDEIGYPLTVETVAFAPGMVSTIHNHGTWGVVAVLAGREKHTFWQRVGDPEFPDRIEPVAEKILSAGELISFTPGAIHCVEAIAETPTITFNIYGDTQPRSRFRFDPANHSAKPF